MAWKPQKGPQLAALEADWCEDLFFGGARGGGKSDFQIGYQEDGALRYGAGWRGIMFRKSYPELEELQARAMQIFPSEGAIYRTQPSADYPFSNCWYWPNGATVKMRYIERESDYGRYHGHQYTGISFDEVTEYASPDGLLKMISTLRSPHGIPCTMRCTGNPGGVGHLWVKARYIDPVPPYVPWDDPESGMSRMYIPSRMEDNQALLSNDPGYRRRIMAATGGSEALRKAWLDGSWDIVAGAFFEKLDRTKHGLRPFSIPESWLKFRSFDWGSAKPFSVGWWAVVQDDFEAPDGKFLPRGALVRYREWYGAKAPNVGLKLTAGAVADGINDRNLQDKITYGSADPAIWKVDGGESIAETMGKKGVHWLRADNSRVSGWSQMRTRLEGEGGVPMLYVFETCTDWWRTVPALQHDPGKPEDVNTDNEDHAGDDTRYACMSRPWNPQSDKKPTLEQLFNAPMKVQDLMAAPRRDAW